MAMVVEHNIAAQLALGELNRNNDKLRKSLEKVSSGMKLVSAKDDASAYVISEKMRVKIRSLDQAGKNVENAGALFRGAEAGIQQQISLVRTIREKVIDANNDTNTDKDRRAMQKEIDQFYDQIDQTAYITDYNTKKGLLGDRYWRTISRWVKAQDVVVDQSSIMNIIPDVYDELDGIDGPFDIFTKFGDTDTAIAPLYGSDMVKQFANGTAGDPSKISYDFNVSYGSASVPSDLDACGFSLAGVTESGDKRSVNYVLSADPSNYYGEGYVIVDISGVTTLNAAVDKLRDAINTKQGDCFTATSSGGVLTLTSTNDWTIQNSGINLSPVTQSASVINIPGRQGASAAGSASGGSGSSGLTVPQYLSGGKDNVYERRILTESRYVYNPKTDRLEYIEGVSENFLKTKGEKATLSVDISGVADGSGVVISGRGETYVKFVSGNSLTWDSDGVLLIGKDASGELQGISGMTLSVENGTMTLTADAVGSYANRYGITGNGFAAVAGGSVQCSAIKALAANVGLGGDWTFTPGTDGDTAYVDTLDLSAYDTNDADKLTEFINGLKGKDLAAENLHVSFIDTTVPYSKEAMTKSGYNIDLKELRTAVQGGANILDTFVDMMTDKLGSRCSFVSDASGKRLRIFASRPGLQGNNEQLKTYESNLAHYDVDFKSWFAQNSNLLEPSPADYLDGKSLRVYCATCSEQWYNVEFYKSDETDEEKPDSTSNKDFTSISIDVSDVTDYKSLVQAIYDQGAPQFQFINHFTYLMANPEDGIVTFYDNRAFDPSEEPEVWHYPNLQEKGAKIADGRVSDVIKRKKDLLERKLSIQISDGAGRGDTFYIPDMRLDTIFGIMPDYERSSIRDYNLASKSDRAALLGNDKIKGALEIGLNYLIDAVVAVGAQSARMEYTLRNITGQSENIQAAESVIRDADMAKEIVAYTKFSVLTQSAQAMLAQANQNGSQVLSLLQ